jgi:hypothetical protein
MSNQYLLVQSGKTASGGCSAGQGSSEPVAPRIYYYLHICVLLKMAKKKTKQEEISAEIKKLRERK